MNSQPLPLDQYVSELQSTITDARFNLDIWWIIQVPEAEPKFNDVIAEYRMFFGPPVQAHLIVCITRLYRVYENKRDTVNFIQLIHRAKKAKRIEPAIAKQFTSVFETEAKPLWTKVSQIRNNAFGHSTNKLQPNDVFLGAHLTPQDLRNLVEITEKLLNDFSLAYCQSTHAFNLSPTKATVTWLNDLAENLTHKT